MHGCWGPAAFVYSPLQNGISMSQEILQIFFETLYDKEKALICWFTPKMPKIAGTKPRSWACNPGVPGWKGCHYLPYKGWTV